MMVFESSLGTTFRVTSVYWDSFNQEMYARGISSFDDPGSHSEIAIKYLTGLVQYEDVTWDFKEDV